MVDSDDSDAEPPLPPEEKQKQECAKVDKALERVNDKLADRCLNVEFARLRELMPPEMEKRLAAAVRAMNLEEKAAAMLEEGYDDPRTIQALSDRDLCEMADLCGMAADDARALAFRLRTSVPVAPGGDGRQKKRCLVCHKSEGVKACSRCRAVFFCNVDCQKLAWPGHKAACVAAVPKLKKPEPEQEEEEEPLELSEPEPPSISSVPATNAAGGAGRPSPHGEWRVAGTWTIRSARPEEAAALAVLDSLNWPAPLECLKEHEIRTRIALYPEGQLVAVADGMIMGSLYTQRIQTVDVVKRSTFRDAIKLHEADGPILQLLTVQTRPKASKALGLGDLLVRHALETARITLGLDLAIAVTRCKTWKKASGVPLHTYARSEADPLVQGHLTRGAVVVGLVLGWRPDDVENDGCGVLVRYDLAKVREAFVPPDLYAAEVQAPAPVREVSKPAPPPKPPPPPVAKPEVVDDGMSPELVGILEKLNLSHFRATLAEEDVLDLPLLKSMGACFDENMAELGLGAAHVARLKAAVGPVEEYD